MSEALYIFFSIVVALLLLLAWALRAPGKGSHDKFDLASLEQSGRRHATYFALIRQASSPADMEFLARRGSPGIAARVRRQRRQVLILSLIHI